MKKHNAWRKARNLHRNLDRAVKQIVRRDDERAEWFNSRFEVAQAKAIKQRLAEYVWFIGDIPRTDEWPSVKDMYIEVTRHEHGCVGVEPGLYVVRSSNLTHGYDTLLDVTEVGTGRDDVLWFPRMGQRVVSCGEVGDLPWTD